MRRTRLRRYSYMRKIRKGPARRGRDLDPKYLSWVRSLPCSVPGCVSRYIEAAHAGERGYGQRADDRTAIPLCGEHHWRGPESHHRLGKLFWYFHNLDRNAIIGGLNEAYDREYPERRTEVA